MYSHPEGKKLACDLCLHKCRINDRSFGICQIRKNVDGNLNLPYFGIFSGLGFDPIEKKPFYHYKPGTKVYSVGYWGCNLQCPFCQNWAISQSLPERNKSEVTPEALIEALKNEHLDSVCHTYSEPSIHIEYLLECAALAEKDNIYSLLVTNGSLQTEPAQTLYSKMAAVNIDLKSMKPEYYHRVLKGNLSAVMDNIRIAAELTHLEVTTLVVPGNNDSVSEIRKSSSFLKEVEERAGKAIPYHLSRYFPHYKERSEPTSLSLMDELQNEALKHLQFVYLGNTEKSSDTHCPECGATAINRNGYRVKTAYLQENNDAICQDCGSLLPIVL